MQYRESRTSHFPMTFFLLYRHLFYMMPGVGQISLVDSETNDIGVV